MATPALHSTPLESPVNVNEQYRYRSGEERDGLFEEREDLSRNISKNGKKNRNRNRNDKRCSSSYIAEQKIKLN